VYTENLALLYREAAQQYGEMPAFATRVSAREWTPLSYRELYERGRDLAAGLIELGVEAREHVGLIGDNRVEWILSDCAVQLCGAVDVPRGSDITDAELVYTITHADIKVTFVETKELLERVERLRYKLPGLKEIILLDPKIGEVGEGIWQFREIMAWGAKLREQHEGKIDERMQGIQPDDLFTLIYTSGTTGKPKGVMLTHSNMLSQIKTLPGHQNMNDRVLSVLPIWHVFERVIEMYTISFGGCTYYSSILTLGDDLKNVEPTFMASAPRLWEKIHERILKGVKASHPVRQALFHIGYYLARQYKNSVYYLTGKQLKTRKPPWWEKPIFMSFHLIRWILVMPWYGFFNAAVLERIRLTAGGSLTTTISGGGALPIQIDRFFNNIGINVLEGYGMTETSPVISVRSLRNLVVGTVGLPIPGTEIQIVDNETGEILYPNNALPDGGKASRGEIWVKGPQVMKGYYREPELTAQSLADGWLRTGDLGTITHDNCLKILGRCKSTIVLNNGENVEPEPIEMRLQQSPLIDYCMVVGQDQKHLGALIVPTLAEFNNRGFRENNLEDLVKNPGVQKLMHDEIRQMISPSEGFKRYEQIHVFKLLATGFQVGKELTNLYKVKRHLVSKKFSGPIEEMFHKEHMLTK
jgi:long-chain acyl-CoA synthetase